ncbi:MAG: apolipoprotein N-acyltransferase [Planctomycetota bacterium]|nr:apolipoprotein N-acyltransferase [Planctomycetota bacterium]
MPTWLFYLLAAICRAVAMPGWLGGWAWPLIFVAVALRYVGWQRKSDLWLDYLAGVVFWGLSFAFLVHVHPLAPIGAALILGSCWFAEGLLYRLLHRRLSSHLAAMFALPAAEYLRMTWFYLFVGGVPWASLGFALESSPLIALADVLGESGLVLFASFGGALLLVVLGQARRGLAIPAIVLLAVALVMHRAPAEAESTLSCLSIQPVVRVEDKNRILSASDFFKVQMEVTDAAFKAGVQPDLLLWAETMWPFPGVEEDSVGEMRRPWVDLPDEVHKMETVRKRQKTMVKVALELATNPPERPVYFLTGAHFYYPVAADAPEGVYSPRNTEFVLFDRYGSLIQHFSKQELVPFGENLPFGGSFPWSAGFVRWAHRTFGLRPDFGRTEQTGPLQATGQLPRLGGAVCWENVFESAFRSQADDAAQAFVILSNEDWFGHDGIEMDQMVAATRLRALESGLAILRCTNTGRTCLVYPDGKVDWGPAPGEISWWQADLPIAPSSGTTTAYRSWGWALLPLWTLCTAVIGLFCLFGGRRKVSDAQPSQG